MLFGLTLPMVIERMNFRTEDPADKRDAVGALMRRVGEEAIDVLGPLEEQRVDGEPLDAEVLEALKDRVLPRLVAGAGERREAKPGTLEQMAVVQQRYLDAMRDALIDERRIGVYNSETYRRVEELLDSMEHRWTPG